jgi:hypothetical protein
MKNLKLIIGVALAVTWGAIFLVMPATAAEKTDLNGANSAESKATVDAEGRGVANFTMSFSGSATTKGNFDGNGMMQNLFDSENRPYYYR